MLAAALHGEDSRADEQVRIADAHRAMRAALSRKTTRRVTRSNEHIAPVETSALNQATKQARLDAAADGLDFGKFRHRYFPDSNASRDSRRARKNSRNNALDSAAITPAIGVTRWFRRGSSVRRMSEPHAPAFGSVHP